ncbi:hypothetical protein LINGRAHAP2_LOCUS28759 [Linum grandiflorum]
MVPLRPNPTSLLLQYSSSIQSPIPRINHPQSHFLPLHRPPLLLPFRRPIRLPPLAKQSLLSLLRRRLCSVHRRRIHRS